MSRPSLEQFRKQAKDLLKAFKAGDAAAVRRVREHCTRERVTLADAQFVIARERGFDSWPKFLKYLSPDAVWQAAKDAVVRGDDAALEKLLRENEQLFRERDAPPYVPQGPGPHYRNHAREIIAREHYFDSWDAFAAFRKDTPFERAVEAIIHGDAATLRRLLREHPDLVRQRSPRTHHSTLLHYVGANGVEGFRQKTPKNAVEIANILLDAGAEVDAMADMYKGSTTLGLVATSIHPQLAGVQDDLIATLLERGAAIDHPNAAGNRHNAVNGCLANGRDRAAETLARRGATLDLEGAAGIGWLDVVKTFFDDDGSLRPGSTEEQLLSGLQWACEYNHANVVEYLIARGADVAKVHRGQTPLHWAAVSGHADIVRLLLDHGAPKDIRDERYDGTPLQWAEYGAREAEKRDEYEKVIAMLK